MSLVSLSCQTKYHIFWLLMFNWSAVELKAFCFVSICWAYFSGIVMLCFFYNLAQLFLFILATYFRFDLWWLIEAAITYTDFKYKYNISALIEGRFFWSVFLLFFETEDLQSFCGYFLAICQLCSSFRLLFPTCFLICKLVILGLSNKWVVLRHVVKK